VEREAVLVGIDVGTSKVCALIGEVGRDGRLTIMGHGTVPASGLKKGVVINIDQTVHSIADAVEKAERLSGWKIDRAFVGVGGQHVESLNSPGQVAVTGHHREVSREDINRAIDVARAVPIPSNREVLHVERRGFSVDGQEGVKDPLGMSALRLEVETHIVTAAATAVTNLSKCVAAAGVKIDELVVNSLASSEAVLNETEKELGVAVADFGAVIPVRPEVIVDIELNVARTEAEAEAQAAGRVITTALPTAAEEAQLEAFFEEPELAERAKGGPTAGDDGAEKTDA